MSKKKLSHELEAKLIAKVNARAWKYPEFKQKLFSNPRGALDDLGLQCLGAHQNIKVVEEKKNELIIVLHDEPPSVDAFNSKDLKEIEIVGGCTNSTCILTTNTPCTIEY